MEKREKENEVYQQLEILKLHLICMKNRIRIEKLYDSTVEWRFRRVISQLDMLRYDMKCNYHEKYIDNEEENILPKIDLSMIDYN